MYNCSLIIQLFLNTQVGFFPNVHDSRKILVYFSIPKAHFWLLDFDWHFSRFFHSKWYSFVFNIAFTLLKSWRRWETFRPLPSACLWINLWRLSFHFSRQFLLWVVGSCFNLSIKIYSYCGYFLLPIPCWKPKTKATYEPPILWSGWTLGWKGQVLCRSIILWTVAYWDVAKFIWKIITFLVLPY